MDSLDVKCDDADFASLESNEMDHLGVPGEPLLFSAEAGEEDFRPRSASWHGPNRPQMGVGATVAATLGLGCCQSPLVGDGNHSNDMDYENSVSDSTSAAAGTAVEFCGSPRNSTSPLGHQQQQQQQQQQKRRNPWGPETYADLITRAIEASPQKRLTLSEIYDWMIKNIAYFSTRGDTISSNGWKNSVRHNLSLHSKFVRIQNEQTSKSSYWTIDYAARHRASNAGASSAASGGASSAPYRRRAVTAGSVSGPELQRKRLAALSKRRRGSGGGGNAGRRRSSVDSTSTPRPAESQEAVPAATTAETIKMEAHQSSPPELQVSSVLHQLVPRSRLLDPSQSIVTLLVETLSDTVLEMAAAAADNAKREAAVAADEERWQQQQQLEDDDLDGEEPEQQQQQHSLPLRSLTDRLHLMTCGAVGGRADDNGGGGDGCCRHNEQEQEGDADVGGGGCCWSAELGLPRIQETDSTVDEL